MRHLLIVTQFGFEKNGGLVPGGLLQFNRCVARALASAPGISKLGVWTQVDSPQVVPSIERMLKVHAHPGLDLEIRAFGRERPKLVLAAQLSHLRHAYDRVMYTLVNHALMTKLLKHPPYSMWEIGGEVFVTLPGFKQSALLRANPLLSISRNTTLAASAANPHLPRAQVVYPCVEPPLYTSESPVDPVLEEPYEPAKRERSVLIVGNMHAGMLYKGHRQLVLAWPQVVDACPKAELWIAGDGDGHREIVQLAASLPPEVSKRILFLGRLTSEALADRYRRCRVFAMPSSQEGFGLVFVEAARYGVPCIGGKYDGVKEIVLDDQTGLLVEQEPRDIALACIRLLTDDQLAKRLGEAGRQRYVHFFRFQGFRDRFLGVMGLA